MHLIIDVGNTLIKLAIFKDGKLQHKENSKKGKLVKSLQSFHERFPEIQHAIISSVGGFTAKQLSMVKNIAPLFILTHKAELPFKNSYSTPSTLGVDRIALISAAAKNYPKENVLVIDCGSCITYDFLNSENVYLGGAISPGLQMRYKAMNTYTANLPLLETKMPENFVGDTTRESMHVGVVQGVIHELEGFIDAYIENFATLTVILTGGDAHFLLDRIKNDIFANSNFLLEGLDFLLEINKDTC
ncbi:MAG: type III pantothenate kinase [Flavobacteriaceae bacterium]|nr:type III pantothenate kinase [Flavobacteriaceae bacterium]